MPCGSSQPHFLLWVEVFDWVEERDRKNEDRSLNDHYQSVRIGEVPDKHKRITVIFFQTRNHDLQVGSDWKIEDYPLNHLYQ